MTDQIIAIDLGTRSTKAVCLEKDGASIRLVSYTIQDRSDFGKSFTRETLSKHLTTVAEALNPKTKQIIMVVGAADSTICHAEMPIIGTSQLRKMVKLNPKVYFQEDLPNYSFDCFVLHQGSAAKPQGKEIARAKTLIVGVKNQLLNTIQSAALSAGFEAEQITASQTGAANCFVMSPESGRNKVVALVDIGFAHSTISLLIDGEINLTRVVNIGADKFTSGLADAMNITYSVAEGLKQIMPEKVNAQLKTLIAPLSYELSNSIHFFEQQEEKKVSEVFVSGGSARSNFIIEILQADLNLPCKSWDPTGAVKVNFTAAQTVALQQEAPQLTVAIGAALAWFNRDLATIDLLAEQKEQLEVRTRDPMRRAYAVAAALVTLMLIWYSLVLFKERQLTKQIESQNAQLKGLQPRFVEADIEVKKATEIDQTIRSLRLLAVSRLLWAPAFDALQHTVVDNFQMTRLGVNQSIIEIKGSKAVTNKTTKIVTPAKRAESIEQTVFTIQAQSFAKPSAAEKFMVALASSPWFKANLRATDGVRLKESQAPQIDSTDPKKMIILFTVECYAERKL